MSSQSAASIVFVRLFRVWSAAREAGDNPLPHMERASALFGPTPELCVACASLFDLVEAHLERRLTGECCCGLALSPDEQALLGLLLHASGAGQPHTGQSIPHGLPGAISWAAFAVRRSLAGSFGAVFAPSNEADAVRPAVCPFGSARPEMEPIEVVQ